MKRVLWISVVLGVVAMPAWAGGLDALRDFVRQTQSAQGHFEQTVESRSGRKPSQTSGQFAFVRPGKFRWLIEKPYPQTLIADGQWLWVYDPDLNQVTRKKIGQALGASPAAVLFGSSDLERNFTLREAGEKDGLQWVDVIPKASDAPFSHLLAGFAASGGAVQLRAMDLHDNFGQISHLRFTQVERNPRLDAQAFRFTPPKGADVVGE